MTGLTNRAQPKKKRSQFQQLWDQAETLQAQLDQRAVDLEPLRATISKQVWPLQRESAESSVKLVEKLVKFGHRKTLSRWQRAELHDWILDHMAILQTAEMVDDNLEETVTRYEAFRFDITLSEADPRSLQDQLLDGLNSLRQSETDKQDLQRSQGIEQMLDQYLGLPPEVTDPYDPRQQEALEDYEEQRELKRAKVSDIAAAMFDDSDPFEPTDEDDELSPENDSLPRLDNNTFKRIFRITASALHPDKEPNPELRKLKQGLMADLLAARKQGDLMAIITLYQQHANDTDTLNQTDEKQLMAILQQQVKRLTHDYDAYQPESPIDELTWKLYQSSSKKTEQAIAEYTLQLADRARSNQKIVEQLTSLKKLMPFLEARYDLEEPV
ncbi:MAG: hypothetical protein JKY89_04330 [Immundisolibacteraceae bacterium]|nr:hypothetical protein [Immundisolibacteraceae bacterium]